MQRENVPMQAVEYLDRPVWETVNLLDDKSCAVERAADRTTAFGAEIKSEKCRRYHCRHRPYV